MFSTTLTASPLAATLHAGIDPFALFFIGGSLVMMALIGYVVLAPDRPLVDPGAAVADAVGTPSLPATTHGVRVAAVSTAAVPATAPFNPEPRREHATARPGA